MKKILITIIMSLAILFGVVDTIHSFEEVYVEQKEGKVNKKLVLSGVVYDSAWTEFMKNTSDLEKGDTVTLYINTPGGSAYSTLAIVDQINSLKDKGVHIITKATGSCMSAGTILWLMGDERKTSDNTLFMFHTVVLGGRITANKHCETWVSGSAIEDCIKILRFMNYIERQLMLDIIKDADIVNELLRYDPDEDDENENFYTGEEIRKLGLTTE
jgi:ATP-dependent protease ClpP protease subunit